MTLQRNKNWNEQLVTEEIRAWQEVGKPLYSHYMRQNYQELLAAGIRYFGTWRTAIEAAGIPYDSVRKYRDWSKERIIETIQRLEKDGVDLSFRSMMLSKYAPMVYASIRPNHFGSWKDALTAAGLAPEEIYRYRSWDDESIISEIRRLKDRAPISAPRRWTRPPTRSSPPPVAVSATGVRPWSAPGSITARSAAAAAGPARSCSRKSATLRASGADLRSGEIRHQHPALFAAACKARFFGSWTKALQASEEPVVAPPRLSR